MKKSLLVCTLAALGSLVCSLSTQAETYSTYKDSQGVTHYYEHITDVLSWDGAYNNAKNNTITIDGVNYQGSLVVLTLADQYDHLLTMLNYDNWSIDWIGVKYNTETSRVEWVDGRPLDDFFLSKLSDTEPFNSEMWAGSMQGEGYKGGVIAGSKPDGGRGGYLIEYVRVSPIPEASSASMGLLALSTLLMRRRRI